MTSEIKNKTTYNPMVIKNKQRKILFSSAGLLFVSGMYYMWSILSNSLMTNYNWTSLQSSLPYTVYTISFVVGMTIAGRIQDKKGPKIVLYIGSILMGLGLILSGIIINPISMILTAGVIGGAGIGSINAAALPPAIKWYEPEKNGFVTGVILGGTGISALFYSPIGNKLINTIGLSKTFIIIGIISMILALVLTRNVENPEIELYEKTSVSENKIQYNWKDMMKTSEFYRLWIMFSFSSAAGLMIISHASTIAKTQIGWQGGTILVIILSLFNFFGRFLGGIGSDKFGRINYLRIIIFLQLVNMFLFKMYNSPSTIIIGALIAGYCYGGNFSVYPATIADLYGRKNYGINYGIMFLAWGVGGIIGPIIAARIFDTTGSYIGAYKVSFVLMIISLIISLTFKIKDRKIIIK